MTHHTANVQFEIDGRRLHCNETRYAQLLKTCFPCAQFPEFSYSNPVEKLVITTTPYGFARFLIMRNDAGIGNDFKNLNAKFVAADECDGSRIIHVHATKGL